MAACTPRVPGFRPARTSGSGRLGAPCARISAARTPGSGRLGAPCARIPAARTRAPPVRGKHRVHLDVAPACPRASCGPGPADAGSPQEDTVPETNPTAPAHHHDPAEPEVDHDHTTADGSVVLPGNPDLRQLRTRAKELRRGVHRGVPSDLDLVARHHPRGAALTGSPDSRAATTLRDAQLALA